MGFKSVGIVVLLCVSAAIAQDATLNGSITVMLLNKAGASRAVLHKAEGEVSRIFRAAGVDITWNECWVTHGCHHILAADEFVLNVIPEGKGCSDGAFGVAFLDPAGNGRYADVFYRKIKEEAEGGGPDPGRMLGAVAAHELGHLVLGSNSHRPRGIMMPVWNETTLRMIGIGGLSFTNAEVALMRAKTRMGRGIRPTTEFTLVQELGSKP